MRKEFFLPWPDTEDGDNMEGMPPVSNPDWDSAPNVIAYRMQQVEHKLIGIDNKLDTMSAHYVTLQMLDLTLKPLKQDLLEIKADAKAEENSRRAASSQLRLALVIALASPIINIIVTIMLDRGAG